ncbi:MAG TPA: hypothetical protein VIF62_12370 [Labilithrix sp.]|jgi:hypothetical protein
MDRPWGAAAVCASVGALDGAIVIGLLQHEETVATALGAHVLVALALGVVVYVRGGRVLDAAPRALGGFAAAIALFLPALGPIGLAALLLLAIGRTKRDDEEPWISIDFQESFEQERRSLRAQRGGVSPTEISGALRNRTPETAEFRFQAALATKKLPQKLAVRLLDLAQSDPSDEVRLYAFSRLERMRDDLEKRIKQINAQLGAGSPRELARKHLRLAECYWELGYLGLAEGAVLEHALRSAHNHAATACELFPQHSSAEFFLGRILIYMRDARRAKIAFERAIAAGYPRVKILPYLAECAFYVRDFGSVRGLLHELDASSPENVFFRNVMDFWKESPAAPANVPPAPGSRKSLRMLAVKNPPSSKHKLP